MPPFFLRGSQENDFARRAKLDKMLPGKDTGPFWGPGERSGRIETGNLQEIAVRTLWDYSRGPKPENLGQKSKTYWTCRVSGPKLLLIVGVRGGGFPPAEGVAS